MKNVFSTLVSSSVIATGLAIVSSTLTATSAQAVQFGFYNITGNDAENAAIGENQMLLDVTESDSGKALFEFSNIGTESSAITQIYFEDTLSLLAGIDLIDTSDPGDASQGNRAGVNFSEQDSPGRLPGSNGSFGGFDAAYEVSPDRKASQWGINPGDTLGVVFDIANDYSFDDLINALTDSEFRVGFHVQDYADGGSEAFVNVATPVDYDYPTETSTQAVPEPAAVAGLGLVFGSMLTSRRKGSNKS